MPSKNTQFKKGKSGNPKGRPKGSRSTQNFAADFLSEANEQIAVSIDGKRQTMSVVRAGMKQLLPKAAAGELSAIKQVLERAEALEAAQAEARPKETFAYTERDREIITYVYENLATETHQAQRHNPRPAEPNPAPQPEPERPAEPEPQPDAADDLTE